MAGKKPKKTDESKETFRPGTEKREIFCLVLGITAELLKEKKIKLGVDSSGELEFTLDPQAIRAYVTEKIKGHVSFDNFITILSTEMESLLMASIFSDKTKGVKEHIPSTIIKDVGIDEFLWRLEETDKVLSISETSKQEAIFKKTVKGYSLKDVKWETKQKVYDDEFGEIDNLKYVTLSIMYLQPSIEVRTARLSVESFSIQLPTITEPKQLTLELQKKDVMRLIDSLQQISEKL